MVESLLAWFSANKRDLPWRRTGDPYAVWVSEIMLQQTQVATVVPYFERWMVAFPTVGELSRSDEQAALSLWQGLGYYRRCKMLLQGARFVNANGIPCSAREWRKVPGVGRYTAGAISSICNGEPVPVVDGNVERVFARLTGCEERGQMLVRLAWLWAERVVPAERPGDWNQALMELGATVCKPTNPECGLCPLQSCCSAYLEGRVQLLPTRSVRPETVRLCQTIVVPMYENRFGVRQIPEGQWWAGMWEFPRESCVSELAAWTGGGKPSSLGQIRHAVTNHRITCELVLLACESMSERLTWLTAEELSNIPMPAPARKALGLGSACVVAAEAMAR